MIEKREHVRAEAYLPIKYKVLSDEDYPEARKRCLLHGGGRLSGSKLPMVSDLDLDSLIDSGPIAAEGMDPLTAKAFETVDRKLTMILRLFAESSTSRLGAESCFPVNLSGGGLMMGIPDKLASGDKLELHITLPVFPPIEVAVIGEVVRVAPAENAGDTVPEYDTAVKFTDIKEDDREMIIKYVFKRQRHTLRNVATKTETA
jgi:hypothetical protein